MKRKAQLMLSQDRQHALDQYGQVLQQFEDLSFITIRNYLRDLRQFMAWGEDFWDEEPEGRCFTPQAVAPSLLICYRDYLQSTFNLKLSPMSRTLMGLKRSFAWPKKLHPIQSNPASPIKFVPKEVSPPRCLSNEEEETMDATGSRSDLGNTTLLLHTDLRTQEQCTLTCQQDHLGKRNGALRILKRKKMRQVPLNMTARPMQLVVQAREDIA